MTPTELKSWRQTHESPKRRGKTHKGYSQSQLAEQLGVSVRTVQDWEQGRNKIPKWVDQSIKRL